MKPTELRIGNYVDLYSSVARVCKADFEGKGIAVDKGEPITLTKEWLLKFGFSGVGVTQELQIDSQMWLYSARGKNVELVIEQDYDMVTDRVHRQLPIKYVHQLQNLYFVLTGEEIE